MNFSWQLLLKKDADEWRELVDLSETQDEVAAEEVMQAARAARGRRAALLAALPAARADIEACDAVAAAAREHAAKAALEAERHSHRAELEGVQVSTRCFLLVVDFGNFRDAWEFLCDSEAVQALSSMTCGLPVKKLQSILILLVNDRTTSRTKS